MPLAVLLYHRVSRSPESASADPHRITVSAARFAEQAEALAAECRVLALDEALREAERLHADPRPTVALTFDDVYADTLAVAEPVLRRHGLPATLFVPTGHVGSPRGYWWDRLARSLPGDPDRVAEVGGRLMRRASPDAEAAVPAPPGEIPAEDRIAGWAQLAALDRGLFSFGCHGMLHHCFAAVPAPVLAGELGEAERALAAHALPRSAALAYPYGFDGCVTGAQVSAAVAPRFAWALTTRRGAVGPAPARDPDHVRRCYVEEWGAERLGAELDAIFHPTRTPVPS